MNNPYKLIGESKPIEHDIGPNDAQSTSLSIPAEVNGSYGDQKRSAKAPDTFPDFSNHFASRKAGYVLMESIIDNMKHSDHLGSHGINMSER